jgi:hypothetical protein
MRSATPGIRSPRGSASRSRRGPGARARSRRRLGFRSALTLRAACRHRRMDAGRHLERYPLSWLPRDEARSITAAELGIAVALFELGLGVVVGNIFELHAREWLDFIASFGSIVLTFLGGLEVDPGSFRERFTASVAIGLVSFIGPFVVGSLVRLRSARLDAQGLPDRGHSALRDVARGHLSGSGRGRTQRDRARQAVGRPPAISARLSSRRASV